MTSSKSLNSANRPLVLLSAAFLLQAGGSLAHAGDAQTQARELLSQTTVGRSVTAQANALSDGTSLAARDAQEQARRLILGTGADGEAHVSALRYAKPISPAEVAAQDHGRVHADAQDMARRIILGAVSEKRLGRAEGEASKKASFLAN